MKDLEREVELLREKVRLLERLRELENKPATIYPIPLYIPVEPYPPFTPWTDGDHTGDPIPPYTIITCDGSNSLSVAGDGDVTGGTVTNHKSDQVTWTQ